MSIEGLEGCSHNGCYAKKKVLLMLDETVKRIGVKESPNTKKLDKVNLLLYTDTADYDVNSVLTKVSTDEHVVSYAYIVHDRDFYTADTFTDKGVLLGRQGEKKKTHVHVSLAFKHRTPISDISLWLGVPQRFIEKCKNYDSSLLYLTHRNAEDKTPYEVQDVHTNIEDYVRYLYDTYIPKKTPIPVLFEYMETVKYPTYRGFLEYYGSDKVMEIRQYWSICRDLINERKQSDDVRNELLESHIKYADRKAETLNKLLMSFGSVKVSDDDGKVKQYTLNDDGSIDMLGYTVGGNK